MKKGGKKALSDAIFYVGFTLIVIIIVLFFIFCRKADDVRVESLPSEEYSVYDGKDVYEYWKTTLNENEQILYDEIKESFLQFKEEFSTQLDEITSEEMEETYTAVKLDHPEIFWMKTYNVVLNLKEDVNTHKKIKLIYEYNEEESKKIKAEMEPNYQKIIDGAKTQKNDFNKVKYVHDELIKNSTYTKYSDEELHDYQSIISIFKSGNTVCAGYTYGFKFIMDELGIESIATRDVSNDDESKNHIWNMVNLYGKWYNLDVTYDGELSKGSSIAYNYFLKSNEEFYTTHKMQKNIPQNEE